MIPIKTLDYHYHLSTIFPSTLPVIPGTESPDIGSKDYDPNDGYLKKVKVVDYRHTRFALDPRTCLFSMVRFVVI